MSVKTRTCSLAEAKNSPKLREARASKACAGRGKAISYRLHARGASVPFDAEYLRLLREGDSDVERDFAAHFGPLLYIKLRRRLGAREAVKDLRQETFARVLHVIRNGDGVRQPERLGSFVHSVCENVLHEYWRRAQNNPPGPDASHELVDSRQDAESELVQSERVSRVRQVLDELPDRDRALLKAVYLEELSREEICDRFGVDREYLRVLLLRARKRFRDSYVAEVRVHRRRRGLSTPAG